ncbi:hypothetical protein CEUSTIGMA_g8066.t1 [Chlamydomonas eustigma]|uniref:Uncharacterized protein n=1 Tax=Chlamydomonas eustigma TaxID=1157962 RepID=A0A250XC31_9CHLO|nr:hypothetical protein CEUSTIGMA_g8066.t1 [Chlamydomonas eustigma]|eukprot:GAX80631.1 hypothetical protein CEUSTIGMA_g8066.t1 [Chlamydomonas eustigma]
MDDEAPQVVVDATAAFELASSMAKRLLEQLGGAGMMAEVPEAGTKKRGRPKGSKSKLESKRVARVIAKTSLVPSEQLEELSDSDDDGLDGLLVDGDDYEEQAVAGGLSDGDEEDEELSNSDEGRGGGEGYVPE